MIGESFSPRWKPRCSSYSYTVDIMAFIKDNPAPTTIILISGDRDFAYLLSTIRWRKYNVVLITNSSMTHESLTAPASLVYDWQSDVLKTRPPSKLPSHRSRREASTSISFPATTQESDSSSGSEVHPVDPPSDRAPLTLQPLALPPRPVSIATTSTTNPTYAALPPDAPLVDSEVIPIPPKPEIPAEVASASIPMVPTSDDRIVTSLTSESTMVHLMIVHSVVTDLGFQQDRSSSGAIDSADEDGVHSPAFVSTCVNVTPTQLLTPEIPEFSDDGSTRG
jgi:hypothetical protein